MSVKDLRVQLKDDILVTSLDDKEGVILDAASKSYYLVNETGLFLLNLMQENCGQAMHSTLTKQLLQEYDVAEDEAERDVSEFLSGLKERCLASVSYL